MPKAQSGQILICGSTHVWRPAGLVPGRIALDAGRQRSTGNGWKLYIGSSYSKASGAVVGWALIALRGDPFRVNRVDMISRFVLYCDVVQTDQG